MPSARQFYALLYQAAEIDLLALRRVHVAPLQRLEIETDRGNRRLQFMRDRVDKAVVLLVAPDLTHQKDRVQDDSRRNRCEEDHSEKNLQPLAPVQDDPTAAHRDGK